MSSFLAIISKDAVTELVEVLLFVNNIMFRHTCTEPTEVSTTSLLSILLFLKITVFVIKIKTTNPAITKAFIKRHTQSVT